MQIRVGMSVHWQGKPMICHRLYELKETRFAPWCSEEYKTNEAKIGNQKILHLEVDTFEEGDIISIDKQVVELVQFGKDIQYIIPYLKVRKETSNGSEGSEGVDRKASENEAEGDKQRVESGPSDGSQSVSADSHPKD